MHASKDWGVGLGTIIGLHPMQVGSIPTRSTSINIFMRKAQDHISQIKSQIKEAISEFVPGSKWRLAANSTTHSGNDHDDILVTYVKPKDQFSSGDTVIVRKPDGQLLEAPKRYLYKIVT